MPIEVQAGDQAIDAARAERPDLILLDANLPGIDGYTVCRLLKADPALSDTPVLFLTVRSNLDDRLAGLTLGADDYLVKPIDMPELMVRIRLLLSRRAAGPASRPPAHSGRSEEDASRRVPGSSGGSR